MHFQLAWPVTSVFSVFDQHLSTSSAARFLHKINMLQHLNNFDLGIPSFYQNESNSIPTDATVKDNTRWRTHLNARHTGIFVNLIFVKCMFYVSFDGLEAMTIQVFIMVLCCIISTSVSGRHNLNKIYNSDT